MRIDSDEEDIDDNLTGQDYIDAVNEKRAAKQAAKQAEQAAQMPVGPEMVQSPNPAIAQPRVSSARQEINRIKQEEQEKEDAEELRKIKAAKDFEKAHPTLVKGVRLGAKILGVASQKINAAGGRFIQDQDSAERVMKKNSMKVPGTKKTAKRAASEDDEIEEEEEFAGMGKPRSSASHSARFPFREFDSESTLPKAAYLPKNQFGKEYKSVGVPVSLRMTGSHKQSPEEMMMGGRSREGIKGMPMLPGGEKGKKGKKGSMPMPMLDEHLQPSDNSGMGEYKSIGNPKSLQGGLPLGNFRNVPVPNSLQGVTLGGTGAITRPVIPKQNITMPPPIPLLKKKGK